MANKLLEGLALAGIDESTRFTLRETWPLIRDSVPYALQSALASMAASSATGREEGSGAPTGSQLDAARERQTKHWESLFAAKFDEEYAESVRRTAVIHAQVGLDPRWLVSGYLTTLTELHSLVVLTHANAMMTSSARGKLDRAIRAVDQAVMFDLQLCISAYTEHTAATAKEALRQAMQRLGGQGQGATPEAAPAAVPAPGAGQAAVAGSEARRAASSLFVKAQGRAFGSAPSPEGNGASRTIASTGDETTH